MIVRRKRRLTPSVALSLAMAGLAPIAASAQPQVVEVTLLAKDRGLVGRTPVATKDIAPRLASLRTPGSGMQMISLRSCDKVPAETVQTTMKDLQKQKFIVMLELDRPAAAVCAR